MTGEDDATVELRPARTALPGAVPAPPPPRLRRRTAAAIGVAVGLAVGLAGGAALWLREPSPAPPSPAPPPASVVASPSAPAAPPAEPGPPLLAEAEILAHRAAAPALLRLRENPRVFVLDFPDLAAQGAALNRVAALVEKAGLPRERVLGEGELAAAIARAGDTAETWYYGHDYRGAALERFFALAARDGVALSPAEDRVRAQLALARRLVPEGEVALISVAAPGPRMDAAMRASILRHEIGHGHYFTIPAYAAHVRRTWESGFTEAERAAFRRFLAAEGYDAEDEDLMANEAQAYLLHTPDARFFAPSHLGMTEEGVERLRALLRDGAPLP